MFRRIDFNGNFVDTTQMDFDDRNYGIYKNGRIDDEEYDEEYQEEYCQEDDNHYYESDFEEPENNKYSVLFDSNLNSYERVLQNKREQALEEFRAMHTRHSR